MERMETEILVIGGGAAGLRAAVEARTAGHDVLVVSKHPDGRGTSTLVSGGAFTGFPQDFSPEDHLARTLAAGRGLNQMDLVEVFVREAPMRLRELLAWGLSAKGHTGSLISDGRPPAIGQGIFDCLIPRARGLGIRFQAGLVVWRIVPRDGGFVSLAWSVSQGRWLLFASRSVVLATGGLSGLFQRHDNPFRMMGEGYVMALDAGATLQDMEFTQFYPLVLAEPDQPKYLFPPSLEMLGPLTNESGENIHEKYQLRERPAAAKARDRLSQALFREIEVEGSEVTLNLTGVSQEDWCRNSFAGQMWGIFTGRCRALEKPLKVAPAAHFVMGGVSIDADCTTSVPGFFVCGEGRGRAPRRQSSGGQCLDGNHRLRGPRRPIGVPMAGRRFTPGPDARIHQRPGSIPAPGGRFGGTGRPPEESAETGHVARGGYSALPGVPGNDRRGNHGNSGPGREPGPDRRSVPGGGGPGTAARRAGGRTGGPLCPSAPGKPGRPWPAGFSEPGRRRLVEAFNGRTRRGR